MRTRLPDRTRPKKPVREITTIRLHPEIRAAIKRVVAENRTRGWTEGKFIEHCIEEWLRGHGVALDFET